MAPRELNQADGLPAIDRLDSWKAIAAHLKRDVSTVQRWERREGMPVHRHVHDKLGSVYAFRHELDRWWHDRRPCIAEEAGRAGHLAETSPVGGIVVDGPSPRRSPRRGAVALAAFTVVVLAVVSISFTRSFSERARSLPFSQRDWVLVTTFENRTDEARLDGMLEQALAHALKDSPYLNVVPRDRIEDALRLMARPSASAIDVETGREIALRDGAIRAVASGRIERVGATYVLTAHLVDPRDGGIVASRREEADTDKEMVAAVGRLADWTRIALGEAEGQVAQTREQLQKVTTGSLRALRLYSNGEAAARAAVVYAGRWAEAEALFGSAVAEDPLFASAHMWLAWAQWQRDVLSAGSTSADIGRRHLAAASRAMDLIAGTTPRERGFIRGSYYWMTGRLESAIGEFEALVRLHPDDFWGLTHLSRLYRYVGRGQAIVEMNARLVAARPNDPRLRVRVAQDVLQASGIEAARPHVRLAADLLEAVPRDVIFPEPLRTYVLLFEVHELWLRGRVLEAMAALDRVAARPEVIAEGVDGLQLLVSFYFTLGQLRRIEDTWAQDQNQHPPFRKIQRAMIALARNDRPAVRSLLGSYAGIDPAPVTFLLRAGELDAAAAVLKRLVPVNREAVQMATAELEAMRGDTRCLEELVSAVPPSARRSTWWRSLQTLADAHVARGDEAKSIEVLEQAAALREQIYYSGAHLGGWWIETQKTLADRYRQLGRAEAARAIERNLLALLVVADEDHAVRVQLTQREQLSLSVRAAVPD